MRRAARVCLFLFASHRDLCSATPCDIATIPAFCPPPHRICISSRQKILNDPSFVDARRPCRLPCPQTRSKKEDQNAKLEKREGNVANARTSLVGDMPWPHAIGPLDQVRPAACRFPSLHDSRAWDQHDRTWHALAFADIRPPRSAPSPLLPG